jgi:hypothetical protein
MKVKIVFKWNRDEQWEAICDDDDVVQAKLDALLDENKDAITPRVLREIYQTIRDENDIRSTKIISDFLMEMNDEYGERMPRYAHYLKDILEYGPYEDSEMDQPITQDSYQTMTTATPSEYGFEVILEIPDEDLPNQGIAFVNNMNEFSESLSDTLWEGMPGSTAVYYNGATIEYYCRKV